MEKIQNMKNNTIINIIIGIIISFIITMLLLIVLAAILTYTNTSESIISPSIIAITTVSILIGSSIVNIKIKKNVIVFITITFFNNRGNIYIYAIHNF